MSKNFKSTYFYNLKRLELSDKDKEIHKIFEIAKLNNFSYGYRRIKLELLNQNIVVNHKKILKLWAIYHFLHLRKRRNLKLTKAKLEKLKPNLLIEKQIVNNKEICIKILKLIELMKNERLMLQSSRLLLGNYICYQLSIYLAVK
ncbi:IS3 family transposase [Mycoplasma testudineum]|uniref:IS3 family transposase n=1 Tax=Mycoplasma testudineum TaxID=244584 RepID=UPI0014151E26